MNERKHGTYMKNELENEITKKEFFAQHINLKEINHLKEIEEILNKY